MGDGWTASGCEPFEQAPALHGGRTRLMEKVIGESHVAGECGAVHQQDLVTFSREQQGDGRPGAAGTHDNRIMHKHVSDMPG